MAISENIGKSKTPNPTKGKGNTETTNELAIALQQSAMQQAQSIAGLIQAYDAGMVQSADVVADAIAQRLDGEQFYGMVLERVAEKSKPVEVDQSFTAPVIDIPQSNPFEQTRETFRALFGGVERKALPNPFSEGTKDD